MLSFLIGWIRRIPVRFSVCFVALLLAYLFLVVRLNATRAGVGFSGSALAFVGIPKPITSSDTLQTGIGGLIVFALLFAGTLGGYNLAALFYRLTRARTPCPPVLLASPALGDGHRLDRFERIGIVLAGGGAKGAYQAGSMRAIYEFLEENNALSKVRMLSGTSIGAWNSIFWLAGLVKPASAGGHSTHEEWWRSLSLANTVEFAAYWPLRRNHFLTTAPWRETFADLFEQDERVRARLQQLFDVRRANHLHFYLTRSNVARGVLEFSTNRRDLSTLTRPDLRPGGTGSRPVVMKDRYEVIDDSAGSALTQLGDAVFASMDLPPLFPYVYRAHGLGHYYEDGGVVDNLPMWFATELEDCDLVFILPLNASFEQRVNQASIAHRLLRVMDVRQGVLERNSFKLAYLYNELAALRASADRGRSATSSGAPSATPIAQRALNRRNSLMSVFAICPQQPLVINTVELWKPTEAGEAFDLMYGATREALDNEFEELTNPNWLRMTLVSPQGERMTFDEF